MRPNYLLFSALFFLAVSSGSADVIDVSADGTVGGDGSVIAQCTNDEGCGFGVNQGDYYTVEFNLSGSNDQLGTLSESGSVTADQRITASGSAQQTTSASWTSISVYLQTSAALTALGAQWHATFDFTDSYTLEFTLTTESLMDLTVLQSSLFDESGYSSFLSTPDGLLTLPTTEDVVVDPGTYVLSYFDELYPDLEPDGVETQREFMDSFSLTANFTPVPEPKWDIIILAALCILGSASLHHTRWAIRTN